MLPQTFPASAHVRIGVLLAPPPVQLLDIAPIDLFHMLSKQYLDALPILPPPIKELAIFKIEIFYIADRTEPAVTTYDGLSSTKSSNDKDTSTYHNDSQHLPLPHKLSTAPLTADLRLVVNSDLNDTRFKPGQLDILFVPGPDPAVVASKASQSFIKSHAESGKTDIISVCTGIYPICQSGICDSKTVTGPRGLLPDLRSKFKNVKVFEDQRWSQDTFTKVMSSESLPKVAGGGMRVAELWTAAGITNGHDCVAAYIKKHFNTELAEIVCRVADVGDRSRGYETSQISENAWWIRKILTALFKSLFRS